MYKTELNQAEFVDFYLPFGGKLNAKNRWVILSKILPWGDIEKYYNRDLDESRGAPAKSSRIALGALIIKEKLGLSDRETVDQILENPYLQYFIGFNEYQEEPPFDTQ